MAGDNYSISSMDMDIDVEQIQKFEIPSGVDAVKVLKSVEKKLEDKEFSCSLYVEYEKCFVRAKSMDSRVFFGIAKIIECFANQRQSERGTSRRIQQELFNKRKRARDIWPQHLRDLEPRIFKKKENLK